MSEITNTFNAAKISDGDVKGSSVEISIRRFCGSLARRLHPWRKMRDPVPALEPPLIVYPTLLPDSATPAPHFGYSSRRDAVESQV